MAEGKFAASSMDFAVKILKLCDGIKGHHSIVNQLERSATSIGANIREQIMPNAKLILFLNYRYHLKNVMKRNTGLNLCLKPEF